MNSWISAAASSSVECIALCAAARRILVRPAQDADRYGLRRPPGR
jgi:hypothetical protein